METAGGSAYLAFGEPLKRSAVLSLTELGDELSPLRT